MQSMPILKLCSAGLAAAALAAAIPATAGPPSVTPAMQRALAKAEEGPEQLRWYVYRTRTIYALDFHDMMAQLDAGKAAAAEAPVVVATAGAARD